MTIRSSLRRYGCFVRYRLGAALDRLSEHPEITAGMAEAMKLDAKGQEGMRKMMNEVLLKDRCRHCGMEPIEHCKDKVIPVDAGNRKGSWYICPQSKKAEHGGVSRGENREVKSSGKMP